MGGGKGGGGRTKSADAAVHPVNVSLGSLDTKRAPPRNKMAAFDASLMSAKNGSSPSLPVGRGPSDAKHPLVNGNLLYGGNLPGSAQGLNMWNAPSTDNSANPMFSMPVNMFQYGLLGLSPSNSASQVPDNSLAQAEYSRQSAEKRRNRIQKRKERKRDMRTSSTSRGGATSSDNRALRATSASAVTSSARAATETMTASRSWCSHSDDEEPSNPPVPQEDDHEGEAQDPFLHRLMTRGLAQPFSANNSNMLRHVPPPTEGVSSVADESKYDCNFSSVSNSSRWPKWKADEIKLVREVVLQQEKSFKRQLEKMHVVNVRHTKLVRQHDANKTLAELGASSNNQSKRNRPSAEAKKQAIDDQSLQSKKAQPEKAQTVDVSTAGARAPAGSNTEPAPAAPAAAQAAAPPAAAPAASNDAMTQWHMNTFGNTGFDIRKIWESGSMSAFGRPVPSQFSSRSDGLKPKSAGLDCSQLSQFNPSSPAPDKPSTSSSTTLMPKAMAATPETTRDILKSLRTGVDKSGD